MLYSKENQSQLKDCYLTPIFGSEASDQSLPKYKIGQHPVDPEIAYRLIKDDLLDEGSARLNLSTFCQTYMEPLGERIMSETLEKNAIDKSEYPQTAELENRCVNIIADLWNASPEEKYLGTSTVGSSEACMLGGMAMKFKWRNNAIKQGLDIHAKKPNLVISSGYQVCWEKFCVYWDIEMRLVPMDSEHMNLNIDTVMDYVDEYTIGIVGILGITYTGKFDDIEALDQKVTEYNAAHPNFPIGIHVDGASGGLFVPFTDPDLKWDFRLKNVVSINASGHKYGLVYPGIGWVLWRDEAYLPKELIFNVSYLGGSLPTMAINFSRSASQIIGQYFNFLRYGFEGYKKIHERTRDVALYLSKELEKTGLFEIYNDGSNLPIVCWKMKEGLNKAWDLYDLADRIRMNGWQVPAYPLPQNLQQQIIQRIVVRADLSEQLAVLLIEDLNRAIKELDQAHILTHGGSDKSEKGAYGFTH